MSNRTYNKLWIDTQASIKDVINIEDQHQQGRPEKERNTAFKIIAKIYIRYIVIYQNLDLCYDQMVHPQKRLLLRTLLDSTIGRIIELKHELVNLDFIEYSFIDDVLADMKITPNNVEIPIPAYFKRDRAEELAYWENIMKETLAKMGVKKEMDETRYMDKDEAIKLLQIHERARQGRLRAKLMRDIRNSEKQSEQKKSKETVAESEDPQVSLFTAAVRIQKLWRGYMTRKYAQRKREEELIFIGMMPPPDYSTAFQLKLDQISHFRRELQVEYHAEYERALVEVKDDLMEKEGPELTETMKDEIRDWFNKEKEEQGKFPEYPSDEEGGSALIFNPESVHALDSDGEGNKKEEKGKKEEKKEGEEEEEKGFRLGPSDFLSSLKDGEKQFTDVWLKKKGIRKEDQPQAPKETLEQLQAECFATFGTWSNRNESHNPRQSVDELIIKDQKKIEVELEIRRQVDNLMREELDLLKAAVERDKGKKGKISKKRKKGKKGSKKGKKKKDKDLTPDRTTESLFEELVMNNVIKPHKKVSLKEYIGNISYRGAELKSRGVEPNPGPADVRRLITEYCILPLGSPELRENTPAIKSVLMVGPEGCGKSMLLNAICTELGATLFDLTATNIVGKYPGKSGLNMLLHLVSKVGRLLQPSVIYIDQAEKTFIKKVSKTDKSDPKRLRKDLPKLVKNIAPEDQMILIGNSRAPWECDQKGLTQAYQKMIYLPKPDYSYRYCLWKELIISQGGHIAHAEFDLSSLTQISDGWTSGSICKCIAETLSEKRVLQQKFKPLRSNEFIPALAKYEPVYKEEEEAFTQWYVKTPMGKKRAKILEGDDDDKAKDKGKKK